MHVFVLLWVCWRFRAILVGLAVHKLLPRGWKRRFRKDLAEADVAALADDGLPVATPAAEPRIRHRKVRGRPSCTNGG